MNTPILVIKLGALGDFFQATGPFAAIRRHHGDAHITLLTIRPFGAFAESAPWFDAVWLDRRPPLWRVGGWMGLRRRLRAARFTRVYDLQTSERSGFYFRLLGPGWRPEWSGIARGCSHPHANPARDCMHTMDRQAEQLAMGGLEGGTAPADFSWVAADTTRFDLTPPFALLAPGGAGHRPEKRWPVENFIQLAGHLARQGIQPVLIGSDAERPLLETIRSAQPGARDLCGLTSIAHLVCLAREAAAAIGNDTGPMHPIAMAGCPSVVLFSAASDPALCAPRGAAVTILRRDNLRDLTPAQVFEAADLALSAKGITRGTG